MIKVSPNDSANGSFRLIDLHCVIILGTRNCCFLPLPDPLGPIATIVLGKYWRHHIQTSFNEHVHIPQTVECKSLPCFTNFLMIKNMQMQRYNCNYLFTDATRISVNVF